MESKIVFNQKDLILKVNENYDRSKLDIGKWERYLDVLCGDRIYQKEAIKSSVIYLASGMYNTLVDIVEENYKSNPEMMKKYLRVDDYRKSLQIKDKLFANIDLATGFRVIIVIGANSYVNIRSSRLLPKFKTQKINSWCAA